MSHHQFKIYFANQPDNVSVHDVYEAFKQRFKVTDVSLHQQFGYIYVDEEMISAAEKVNKHETSFTLNGQPLVIAEALSYNKLYDNPFVEGGLTTKPQLPASKHLTINELLNQLEAYKYMDLSWEEIAEISQRLRIVSMSVDSLRRDRRDAYRRNSQIPSKTVFVPKNPNFFKQYRVEQMYQQCSSNTVINMVNKNNTAHVPVLPPLPAFPQYVVNRKIIDDQQVVDQQVVIPPPPIPPFPPFQNKSIPIPQFSSVMPSVKHTFPSNNINVIENTNIPMTTVRRMSKPKGVGVSPIIDSETITTMSDDSSKKSYVSIPSLKLQSIPPPPPSLLTMPKDELLKEDLKTNLKQLMEVDESFKDPPILYNQVDALNDSRLPYRKRQVSEQSTECNYSKVIGSKLMRKPFQDLTNMAKNMKDSIPINSAPISKIGKNVSSENRRQAVRMLNKMRIHPYDSRAHQQHFHNFQKFIENFSPIGIQPNAGPALQSTPDVNGL